MCRRQTLRRAALFRIRARHRYQNTVRCQTDHRPRRRRGRDRRLARWRIRLLREQPREPPVHYRHRYVHEYQEVDYPRGGRGSMCVLPHPSRPLLYLGIQRGGSLNGRSYFGRNCFLATYDLTERRYIGNLYLAEVENGRSDDATPACLTYDKEDS